jgi:hypothetical protein
MTLGRAADPHHEGDPQEDPRLRNAHGTRSRIRQGRCTSSHAQRRPQRIRGTRDLGHGSFGPKIDEEGDGEQLGDGGERCGTWAERGAE